MTQPIRDSSHPVWNACFSLPGTHTADTPVAFVALDADFHSEDDVIGTACTTAAAGQVWLDLTGPAEGDNSDRGRIKVRTMLFATDAAATSAQSAISSALGWETVMSAPSVPVANAAAVTASIECPAGKRMTACTCVSKAAPGCAASRIGVVNYDSGAELCVATANVYVPAAPLPPCPDGGTSGDSSRGSSVVSTRAQRPGIDCAAAGTGVSGPDSIRASARCVTAPPLGAEFHDEVSRPSRSATRDATDARCSSGTLTGCSISSDAGGLGTRYEDGDGDGLPECVGYSDGEAPASAQARCARISPTELSLPASIDSSSLTQLSLPAMASTALGGSGAWTAAACPSPFRLSGCGCFSEAGNCLGAQFAQAPLEAGGDAGGDAGGGAAVVEVCNVSQAVPPAYWRAGAEAHAMCLWIGPEASMLSPVSGGATTCSEDSGDHSLPDKAWLPRNWRDRLRVSADSGRDARGRRYGSGSSGGFGMGFFSALLVVSLFGSIWCLISLIFKARRRAALGGAPTMRPATRAPVSPATWPVMTPPTVTSTGGGYTGGGYTAPALPVATAVVDSSVPVATAVVPVASPMPAARTAARADASAPLVLSDSAQANAFHADVGSGGSRV